jgi:hypothetical protein
MATWIVYSFGFGLKDRETLDELVAKKKKKIKKIYKIEEGLEPSFL